MNVDQAKFLAYVAHTAVGQMRADGATPYIAHPARVAGYTRAFSERRDNAVMAANFILEDRLVAAWLHDVVEDTKVAFEHLTYCGITPEQLAIVKLLTKPDSGPARPEYYAGIATSIDALVVKCADRCANLDDALKELLDGREVKRWLHYANKTERDIVPLYDGLPMLQAELVNRIHAIWAIPTFATTTEF